ncbi:MAG: glucose-6-phosphate isomerase [Candidatus Omnitrophota bacterium]|nr:MAG: glucose-6-phosphate isomerase [Candidatus Omnitrophota bacterium]
MMRLNEFCGLDIKLDTEKTRLTFGQGLNYSEPGVRSLDQMKEVLLDKNISEPKELYYMYRDVYRIADKALLEKNKLRYDVTLIKPDALGREFMKTAGHYHPQSFGELYEVVYGHCYCLLQKPAKEEYRNIEEVVICEAKAGQKIVIPPGFGHILINPGPDLLITSNWVSSVFSSEYQLYKEAQGAAYFMVKSSTKEPGLIPNTYFKQLAKIKSVKPNPRIEKFGLLENEPIYPIINENAEKLSFLNHPLDFDYSEVFI